MDPLLITTTLALFGIVGAVVLVWLVNKQPIGTEQMKEVWQAIRQGSNAYLKRQFKTIGLIAISIAVAILVIFEASPPVAASGQADYFYAPKMAGAFLFGVACSLLAAYISMDAATRANVRTTNAAGESTYRALRVATYGGTVLGLSVISISLLGLSVLYYVFKDPGILAGFGFGASLAALFAQLGGGIYTKAADIGADLVGKVEEGIPEDDPRNPAVIADNVGDNVGDCAGRGADLFESVTAENIGGMIIGLVIYFVLYYATGVRPSEIFILLPLLVRAIGIIATYGGVGASIFIKHFKDPMEPLRFGLFVSAGLCAVLLYFTTTLSFGFTSGLYLYGATLCGIVASILVVLITEIYTSSRSKYVVDIAKASQSGPAITILSGLSAGMESTALPIVVIAIALLFSFIIGQGWAATMHIQPFLGGIYGTTGATMGMLSVTGMILTMDGVGPISDNAGGIAEMAGCEEQVRQRLEPLDALGNTTKALTKGYAMASAALASLLLFQAFVLEVARYHSNIWDIALVSRLELHVLLTTLESLGAQLPLNAVVVVVGVLIGAMLPFLFSSAALHAVSQTAYQMVNEVRRQFREIPGLREGKAKPDYAKCVDISTRQALKLMVAPGLIAVVTPIIVGYLLGWAAVGALVIGATVSAVPLAIMMMWGGCAWDNAKKYIEHGNLGGKHSPTHAAAVVGDTVGDPLKDTAGPSLHILIKLLNTISLVFIPLFLIYLARVFGL
jgi:K(+)-stimulated pyrophosphate-energized sodium pump